MAGREFASRPELRPLRSRSAEELELSRRPLEIVLRLNEALAAASAEEYGAIALATLEQGFCLPAALLFAQPPGEAPRLLGSHRLDPRLAGPAVADLARLAADAQGLEVQALGFHPRLEAGLRARLEEAGYQALLDVPLEQGERRTGSLLLLLRAPRVLSLRQSETLLAVGRALGAALAVLERRRELERALAEAQEALHYCQERYQQLGISDALTGLYNGRHFHGMLEAEVERARRFGDALGLLLLDIDDLKRFNEAHGREAGDQVLSRLGHILRWSVRKIDSGFRYGGEEFAVILPRCDREALVALAERVRAAFAAEAFPVGQGEAQRLSVSIGAALYRRGAPLESFIRSADRALYEAKRGGKNQVVLLAP